VATLAADKTFASAGADWRDGVALQAVYFTADLGLADLVLKVALSNQGIASSATAASVRGAICDCVGPHAPLPAKHVAAAALALEPEALREYFEGAELERCAKHGADEPDTKPSAKPKQACGLGPDDKLPPYALAEAASAVVLGWYPEPGDALWQG